MIMAQSLVVLKFDTPEGAEQGLAIAVNLQKQHLLEIQDAAVVTWPKGKKKPKTRHGADACSGARDGAVWGMLFGWIFFVPFLGDALGAAVGALSADFAGYGIGNDFLSTVRGKRTQGPSELFL